MPYEVCPMKKNKLKKPEYLLKKANIMPLAKFDRNPFQMILRVILAGGIRMWAKFYFTIITNTAY